VCDKIVANQRWDVFGTHCRMSASATQGGHNNTETRTLNLLDRPKHCACGFNLLYVFTHPAYADISVGLCSLGTHQTHLKCRLILRNLVV